MGRARPTHVPDPKALGIRLRELRERRGLSLREIAFPGCSPSYLSRVESGDRVASLTILAELARRLETSVEELLGRSLDGRVSEADLVAAEVAARMGEPTAEANLETLLAGARSLGDERAESQGAGMPRPARARPARRCAVGGAARAGAGGRATPNARERPALFRALGRAHAGTGDLIQSAAVLQEAFDEVCETPADVSLMVQFGSYLANVVHRPRPLRRRRACALAGAPPRAGGRRSEPGAARLGARPHLRRAGPAARRRDVCPPRARADGARRGAACAGHAHLLIAGVLLDQDEADGRAALDQAEQLLSTEDAVELALLSYERGRAALLQGDLASARAHAETTLRRTEDTEPGTRAWPMRCSPRSRSPRIASTTPGPLQEGIRLMTDRAAPPYIARAYETLSRIEEQAGNLEAALEALRSRPTVRAAQAMVDPRPRRYAASAASSWARSASIDLRSSRETCI